MRTSSRVQSIMFPMPYIHLLPSYSGLLQTIPLITTAPVPCSPQPSSTQPTWGAYSNFEDYLKKHISGSLQKKVQGAFKSGTLLQADVLDLGRQHFKDQPAALDQVMEERHQRNPAPSAPPLDTVEDGKTGVRAAQSDADEATQRELAAHQQKEAEREKKKKDAQKKLEVGFRKIDAAKARQAAIERLFVNATAIDLAFLVDATGSMAQWLREVIEKVGHYFNVYLQPLPDLLSVSVQGHETRHLRTVDA
jgi:hypothetical protein